VLIVVVCQMNVQTVNHQKIVQTAHGMNVAVGMQ